MWFFLTRKRIVSQSSYEDKRQFTFALQREQRARLMRRDAEAAIVVAERAILDSNEGDRVVENFVKWLPQAREAIELARETEREAGFDVALAFYNKQDSEYDRPSETRQDPSDLE